MGQLTGIAQGHYRNADRQVTQIEELQTLVTEKEEIITEREETILHWEDQINESDAIITQRNTIIEFLQEQIHDLILEIDDAHAHIDELRQQPVLPAIPEAPEGEEEDPEEIEGVSDLNSEHENPEPHLWQNCLNYSGSKQVYLARRRVYNHTIAHQHLIYRILNIITNRFKLKYTYTNIVLNDKLNSLSRFTAEEINTRLHTSRRLTPSSARNMVSFRRVTASRGRIPLHGPAKRNRDWPCWTICGVLTGHT
jgi:hypothetical protein